MYNEWTKIVHFGHENKIDYMYTHKIYVFLHTLGEFIIRTDKNDLFIKTNDTNPYTSINSCGDFFLNSYNFFFQNKSFKKP